MIGLIILIGIYWSWLEDHLTLRVSLTAVGRNSKISVCHVQLPPYHQSATLKHLYHHRDNIVVPFCLQNSVVGSWIGYKVPFFVKKLLHNNVEIAIIPVV
jgi:hypothetical protein